MTKFDKHILACYYYCNKIHYSGRNTFLNNLLLKIVNKYYRIVLKFFYGAFIPFRAKIGKNVIFLHSFHGVFISQNAEIGENCRILHHVTIGSNIQRKGNQEAPKIGNNVFIGANACVIGSTQIKNNCNIGAGVVISNQVIDENSIVFNDKPVIKKKIKS